MKDNLMGNLMEREKLSIMMVNINIKEISRIQRLMEKENLKI